ncbi:MAG: STAS domain-containing protein [Pedobacter sp.]
MLKNTTEKFRVCLDGDWSMTGVAERFPFLEKHLSVLTESQSIEEFQSSESYGFLEIDLAGINALDVCGCQLLAIFIRNLRQCGVTPRITNIPDTFRSKIHFLGFDREFNLSL